MNRKQRRAATNQPHAELASAFSQALALHQAGRLAEAERIYGQILKMEPNHFDSLHLVGVIYSQRGNHVESVRQIDLALKINPKAAYAHNNRGNILMKLQRLDEALASFDKAIALKPDSAEAFNNRGNALQELNRLDDALASYDKAIAYKSDYAEAFNNRGLALQELNRLDDALASCDKAIALKPNYAEAFYNRGSILRELNRLDDVLASYDKAIALKPDYAEAQFALCMAELPILYENEPEITVRRTAYERRLNALCEAGDRSTNLADLAKGVGSRQPFLLAYQGYNDRDLQALYGCFVCRAMAKRYPPAALGAPPGETEPVRVGIVSGFFRHHSNWKLPIKGWLSQLDRQRFRAFGYHTGNQEDGETKVAASFCDRFVQGPLPLDRWRQEILADAPHILIYPEVGMDPISAQLAAQRLAPVQCNSWGHPETSGFPTLDYYLSSDLMEPPDGQDHYTERLVRLPNLSVYCEPIDPPPVSITRQDLRLRSTAIVYWCGQSLFKYLPQFDEVFPRIARAVGDCQFAFIQHQRGTHITNLFSQRLDRAFGALSLNADEYCCFLPRLDQSNFLAASGQCDVFLDSINWSGCNSTLESLPHNLPIVTTGGPLMRGRHSMAILRMMGVTETIAETIDDYVSIAVRLARDVPWRMAVKAKISANKHRIYFDSACILGLEQFLTHVVRRNPSTAPRVFGISDGSAPS
jgi:protein O-GlcNAc transferase